MCAVVSSLLHLDFTLDAVHSHEKRHVEAPSFVRVLARSNVRSPRQGVIGSHPPDVAVPVPICRGDPVLLRWRRCRAPRTSRATPTPISTASSSSGRRLRRDGMAYNRRKEPLIRDILDRMFRAHGLL
jgi:hypothetical protein